MPVPSFPAPLFPSRLFLVGLLSVHLLLAGYAAAVQAPLVDEPKHLIAGIAHRRLGRFDIYSVNPPLPRSIASLAVECFGTSVDWSQFHPDPMSYSEAAVACDFVEAHGAASRPVFMVARWLCLPFTVLGALVCYSWGRDLYGPRAGAISMACWCFCPNVLGFAGVILPDLPAAALAVTAAWLFWHWLREPTWKTFLLAAFALGLALLAKTTLIILPAVCCVAWIANRLETVDNCGMRDAPSLPGLVGLLALSLYILNLGYAFEGSGTRLADYEFVSPTLSGLPPTEPWRIERGNRFRDSWLGAVPLPLPHSFVTGIDLQKRDFDLGMDSYLRGRWEDRGWWYYYLYALLVKVPVPVFLLLVMAAYQRNATRVTKDWTTRALLLGTPIAIFVAVSSQTGFSHHLRYVLPVFPFAYVAIGAAGRGWRGSRACRTLLVVALAWLVYEGVSSCPHGVSYFNELVGGPRNGHRHLLHSNCDWGQDLYHLDRWIKAHQNARPILVDYYGLTSADAYGGCDGEGVRRELPSGSRFEALCRSQETFWVALSVTRLSLGNPCYRQLDWSNPRARVGDSILVFEVPPSSAARLCR